MRISDRFDERIVLLENSVSVSLSESLELQSSLLSLDAAYRDTQLQLQSLLQQLLEI